MSGHKPTVLGMAVWAALAAGARAQVTEVVLNNFPPVTANGSMPYAGVTLDAEGNLYGTTTQGGASNAGIVYRVDAAGKQTVRYNFTGGADGGKPEGGVTLDTAGNIYGTASMGGANNAGVVYKVDPEGNETVLYSFSGKLDGATPEGTLIQDSAGNLYGTAYAGGAYQQGVLFMVDPAGKESVVFSFMGGANGARPAGNIVRDSNGNFYGTTWYGGTNLPACAHPPAGCGVVFKISAAGQETVLHTFVAGSDGAEPYGGVIRDSAGNLYGTTYYGGTNNQGIIFKISPQRQETILHDFGASGDGANPQAGLVRDSSGNLYGTTTGGGGTVYKLSPTGQLTLLHQFPAYSNGPDGSFPYAGVTLDGKGNLYGTTQNGGPALFGALYQIASAGQEVIFACFNGPAEGSDPQSGLVRDGAGNLYGTTYYGGPANFGVVYQITAGGKEQVLKSFTGGADGGNPIGQLIRDSAGNLYGVTFYGGKGSVGYVTGGVIYKIDSIGHETVLHTFAGDVYPEGTLARDAAGNLYGATFEGGKTGCYGYPSCGEIYKLTPSGHYSILYQFGGNPDGGNPNGGLVLDAAGNLYGATARGGTDGWGVVYELNPAGDETVLYTFTGGGGEGSANPGGGIPETGVVRDAAGNLYGTTIAGGTAGWGVVYQIDTGGNENVLFNFNAVNSASSGVLPYSSLILDSSGNLYGTATAGGTDGCSTAYSGCGVVYSVSSTGEYQALYVFAPGASGGNPQGPLTMDASGNLYGTASTGGSRGGGVVFKLEGAVPKTTP